MNFTGRRSFGCFGCFGDDELEHPKHSQDAFIASENIARAMQLGHQGVDVKATRDGIVINFDKLLGAEKLHR
jgi:hypothetical protein